MKDSNEESTRKITVYIDESGRPKWNKWPDQPKKHCEGKPNCCPSDLCNRAVYAVMEEKAISEAVFFVQEDEEYIKAGINYGLRGLCIIPNKLYDVDYDGTVEVTNYCAHDACPVDGACEACKEPIKLARLVPAKEEVNDTFVRSKDFDPYKKLDIATMNQYTPVEVNKGLPAAIPVGFRMSSHATKFELKENPAFTKHIVDSLEPVQVKNVSLLEAAKYGYEYHQTTSFPESSFDENCKNNFLQLLQSKGVEVKKEEEKCDKCGATADEKHASDCPDKLDFTTLFTVENIFKQKHDSLVEVKKEDKCDKWIGISLEEAIKQNIKYAAIEGVIVKSDCTNTMIYVKNNQIFRSIDRGVHYVHYPIISEFEIRDIKWIDRLTWECYGIHSQNILRSTDDGLTWCMVVKPVEVKKEEKMDLIELEAERLKDIDADPFEDALSSDTVEGKIQALRQTYEFELQFRNVIIEDLKKEIEELKIRLPNEIA